MHKIFGDAYSLGLQLDYDLESLVNTQLRNQNYVRMGDSKMLLMRWDTYSLWGN